MKSEMMWFNDQCNGNYLATQIHDVKTARLARNGADEGVEVGGDLAPGARSDEGPDDTLAECPDRRGLFLPWEEVVMKWQ